MIHGIPHGSLLGPRLIITHINDMCNISSFLSISYLQMTQLFLDLAMTLNYQAKKLIMNELHSVNGFR